MPVPDQQRVSPHTLRHTTAMHLLRAGNDVNMVGYWLGHADINTTHLYVEIDMEMKRRMLEKAPSPAVTPAAPWRQPGILDWLDGLTKAPRLCAADCEAKTREPRINGVATSSTSHNSELHITFASSPRPVVFAGRKPTGKDP